MSLDIIILAAGQGTRMKSGLPKVLQNLAGRPLLEHVVATAMQLHGSVYIVIGHGAEMIRNRFASYNISWVMQEQQRGTGHAVAQAMQNVRGDGVSLVLYGDVPLIRKETLEQLIGKVSETSMAILSVNLPEPKGYGRIVRDHKKSVQLIVEEKDANSEQKKITEVNTGILAVKTGQLKKLLPKLKDDNAQGEYYLTDIIGLAVAENLLVDCLCIDNETEVQGVNDKKQLALLERAYQKQMAEILMGNGVTIIDPARIDIRGTLVTGRDVTIDVNCVFQGSVTLADGVSIGPNCVIGEAGQSVSIGENVEVRANSIIEEAVIGSDCTIGPFARLRPGTRLGKNAKIGNFVETKKADIGDGSKVSHLTYIGDATIGREVNIGAGTITCNYDGVNKYQTVIEDYAFIGSNTAIIAPLTIGEGATVAAGSTVNQDIGKGDLAVARSKQKNIQGWQKPKKK